jgi:hypothetical protein
MTRKRKILLGVTLAIGVAVALFVIRGGNTVPGRMVVAAAQKLMPPSATPPTSPSARALATTPSRSPTLIAPTVAAAHPPLPLQNVPIAPYFEELKRRADAGEPAAACRLSFEVARCEMRPALRHMASSLGKLHKDDNRSEQVRASLERQLTEIQDQISSVEATCKDVPDLNAEDLWRYALVAAQSGNVRAMVHFASFPPGLSSDNMLGQMEGWMAWRANVADFVTGAVEAGDPSAVELAAHMHLVPRLGYQVLPLDPVRGLAHYYALQQYANPGYRRMLQQNIEYISQRFNLTPAQLAEAQARSSEIASKMARAGRTAESVDFRKGSGYIKDAAHCE